MFGGMVLRCMYWNIHPLECEIRQPCMILKEKSLRLTNLSRTVETFRVQTEEDLPQHRIHVAAKQHVHRHGWTRSAAELQRIWRIWGEVKPNLKSGSLWLRPSLSESEFPLLTRTKEQLNFLCLLGWPKHAQSSVRLAKTRTVRLKLVWPLI